MCCIKRWFDPDENGAYKNTQSLELFLTQNSCYTLGLHEQRASDRRQKETLLVPIVLSQENTSGRPSATYSRQEGKGLTFRRLQPRRLQIRAIERSILQRGRPTQHSGEKMTEGEPSTAPPN